MAQPAKEKPRKTKITCAELNTITSRVNVHSVNFDLKKASNASDEATLDLF